MKSARRIGFLCAGVMGVALSASCGDSRPAPPIARSAAALTAAGPAINTFVVYAADTVTLGSNDQSAGGNIGVGTTGGASPQLVVGSQGALDVNHTLVAPSITIGSHAVVGPVDTNALTNNGGQVGAEAAYPSPMPPLPSFAAPATGTMNITVPQGPAQTLTPGSYGALTVDGVANLDPGTYSFTSVTLGNNAQIQAQQGGSTLIYVSGTLTTGTFAQIIAAGQTANHLVVSVAGSDGAGGQPPAVSIGANSQLTCLLAASSGSLSFGNQVQATGAFAGQNFTAGSNVTLNFQSGFPIETPTLSTFVAYAELTMSLGSGVQSLGGDFGVAAPAASNSGAQFTVGSLDLLDSQHTLYGPSISLASQAQVGDIETNSLTNSGGRFGAETPFPSGMPLLPLVFASTATGSSITVSSGGTQTLTPGAYGALTVDGTLNLDPGAYTFSSVTLGNNAHVIAQSGGATSILVSGSLATGTQAQILPLGQSAGALTISVAGYDGANGSSLAATIGQNSQVTALLAVPNGTASIGASTQFTGAVAAFAVTVGNNATLNFQSGLPSTTTGGGGGGQVVSSYTLPPASPILGPVPASTVLSLAVALPLRNLSGLQGIANAASDPTSSSYRHDVPQSTFMSQYAPLGSDYMQLQTWAQSNGLTVGTYPNNILVDVTGTAAQLEATLGVALFDQLRSDGSIFYGPDRVPTISLAVTILGLSGIDDYVPMTAMGGSTCTPPSSAGSCPSGTYLSADIRSTFAGYPSSCSSLTGQGQSIGLFALSGFNQSDICTYEATAGLTNVPAVQVETSNDPNGGSAGCPTCTGTPAPPMASDGEKASVECTIDIEMAMAMAPQATIVVFEGRNPDSILENMIANPQVSQISSSVSFGISAITPTLMTVLAAQGQSYFTSSGDDGAFQTPGVSCTASGFEGPPTDSRSLNYTTVVGGVNLESTNGVITAWPDSGGGVLPQVMIPKYQQNVNNGIANADSNVSSTNRNLPDVSLVSSNMCEFVTECAGKVDGQTGQTLSSCPTGASCTSAGNGKFTLQACPLANQTSGQAAAFPGTSLSSPMWAGYMALINQQMALAGPVGFANPILYQIFTTPNQDAISDINDGSDNENTCGLQFDADPGYDLVTGLGTPSCLLIPALSGQPQIQVGATGTPNGPVLCVSGQGFTAGGTVTVQYAGVPGFQTPTPTLDVITTTQPVGAGGGFTLTDNETTTASTAAGENLCSASEIASGVVSVNVVDNTTGVSATVQIPASVWCTINPSLQIGKGCLLPQTVTIEYEQIGACNGTGTTSPTFGAGPNAAYLVFGIQDINNTENTASFNFNPANLYVQQATAADFFNSTLAIYADFFGPFAVVPGTVGPTGNQSIAPYALGATIVTTTDTDGAAQANMTSFLLNYKQGPSDPLVVTEKSNASQTTYPDTEDCANVVPP